MLTQIIERDPGITRRTGPTTELDEAIIRHLRISATDVPLQQITKAVKDNTHHVHARVVVLMGKGLVERIQNPTGPTRGPGASTYRLVGG